MIKTSKRIASLAVSLILTMLLAVVMIPSAFAAENDALYEVIVTDDSNLTVATATLESVAGISDSFMATIESLPAGSYTFYINDSSSVNLTETTFDKESDEETGLEVWYYVVTNEAEVIEGSTDIATYDEATKDEAYDGLAGNYTSTTSPKTADPAMPYILLAVLICGVGATLFVLLKKPARK